MLDAFSRSVVSADAKTAAVGAGEGRAVGECVGGAMQSISSVAPVSAVKVSRLPPPLVVPKVVRPAGQALQRGSPGFVGRWRGQSLRITQPQT